MNKKWPWKSYRMGMWIFPYGERIKKRNDGIWLEKDAVHMRLSSKPRSAHDVSQDQTDHYHLWLRQSTI
jgi:hypothetical protein